MSATEDAARPGPEAARARLAEIEAAYPFPDGEIRRLGRRRWILQHVPRGGIGAEIGVFRGHFTAQLCATAQPRRLYLVDPWTRIGPVFRWGGEYSNGGTLPTALAREQALLHAALTPEVEVVAIEDFFPACAARIPDRLDWIYLDASHEYAATLAELEAAAAMLTPGGVLLGDDWTADPRHRHYGVFRACQDFVRRTDFRIVGCGHGAQWCLKRM